MRRTAVIFVLWVACLGRVLAADDGRVLVESALQRHVLPDHVYAEHALVQADRHGHFSVRTARQYRRSDADGSLQQLLVIETPVELRGTALYVERDRAGRRHGALGNSAVFGSDFRMADLEAERPDDFRYVRSEDQVIDRVPHAVVRAWPADAAVADSTGYQERILFLRKDTLFVSRIDYLDRSGRPVRRQTFRDPQPVGPQAWQAGMVLMEDLQTGSRSLLKMERRVHSADYVPATVFAGWRRGL